MKSVIFGGDNSAASTSAVNYNWITAVMTSSYNSTEVQRTTVVPIACTIDQLYVELDTAPGTSKSYTFILRKNGADTALTLTISGANVSASDGTHSVSFAAGDTIALKCSPSSTPAAFTNSYWNLQADATDAVMLGGSSTAASNAAANYSGLIGAGSSGSQWSATEVDKYFIVPAPGTLRNLYVTCETAPAAGKSYDYTLMVNGSASALTANVSGTGTTANDTTHTVSVNAGDTVSMRSNPNSTPTASRAGWGLSFSPTTDGDSFFGFSNIAAPSVNATQFEQILNAGNNGWTATESTRYMILGPYKLKKIYVALTTAPGIGASRIITLRQNGADTGLSVTISDLATSGNIATDVTYAQGDKITLEDAVTGTPAATLGVHTGVLISTATSVTTQQTIQGISRIQITSSQTLLGQSRITATTLRTIQGLARITASTARTITGKADILNTTQQTVTGKSRIQITTSRTLLGKASIAVGTNKTIQGLSRITAIVARTLLGKGDIAKTTLQTILGKSDILRTTSQTLLGQSRITVTTSRTLTGKARLQRSASQTVQGIARILRIVQQTITGKARVTATAAQTIQGHSRVQITTSKLLLGRSRIGLITSQDLQGIARLTATTLQTIDGKSRVLNSANTTQQTIKGVAHICVDEWQQPNTEDWQTPNSASWYTDNSAPWYVNC